MARPRKPSAVMELTGASRHDPQRRRENEPQIAAAIPKCPVALKGESRRVWGRISQELFDLGLVTNVDRAALTGYCALWGRWFEAEKTIRKFGSFVKGPREEPVVNPAVAMAGAALAEMRKYLVEFGMTPAARSRVTSARPKEESGNLFAEMASENAGQPRQRPIYDLLRTRPNDQQTAFEFKQMLQGHLELRGNAYAEIMPGPRGAVDQLWPMHPDRVTVQRLAGSGKLRYAYNDPVQQTTRYLMQDEVFHLRNFMDDGVTGQSTVSLAVDTIGVAMAAQDYTARFFQNDAKPGMALTGAAFNV